MVSRAIVAMLCVGLTTSSARGEPCPEIQGLPTGTPAPCDGVLVPPDFPDACTSVTASLMSCRRRIAGLRDEHRIELERRDQKIASLERARQDERAAGAAQVAESAGTDWSAFGWGVVGGLVLAGLIAGGVVLARP